ncbi:MAG: zinc ribbon domain-containing protein, partial [Symbiobacteriaceae bacterium]|nr:zinc ribbon domain-containing protein [Symbiobacteriaceae bacterium]
MPYDLFDFLGIEFDPPESPKRVNDAFTLKIRDIQGLRSTSSDPLEQSEYAKQLAFLAEMKREVLAADEKQFTLRFSQLAAERTQQSLVALAEMLQIEKMVYSTKPVVTKAKVNELRKSFRLSAAKVEQGLAAAGFTVAELPITMPDFPPNAPRIVAEMAALREMPDPRSSPQQVYDLYSFCAYLEGTPGEGARYQRMSSPELQVLLDKYAVQYAGHIDPLGKCCASLAALCKSYIVNNDTNRQAFELYLQYRSSELTKLFASFKHIPKGRLRNPTLAEAMIAVIVKELGNISGVNEIALAIYNQEADLLRDPEGPYLPHEILFRLKCAHCLESVVFPDEETAQRINRCPNCGNPLYTTCPQCQTAIIALAARCPNPSCGYILARTGRFQEHVHQAQDALLQGNLVMAREQLVKASQTNPALHDTLTSLEQRITQEEDLFIAQAA